MTDCAVIGGGIAGLSAAVKLASAGHSVALFEARPHCGGRAFAFADSVSGSRLDNGQHILMGCYTETLSFLDTIGASHLLTPIRRMRIPFFVKNGPSAVMKSLPLPYPLDALSAFWGFGLLSFRERMQILRVLLRAKQLSVSALEELDSFTVQEWLSNLGQGERARKYLWGPIVLATMNAKIEQASAYLFAIVLREAFLAGKEAATFLLPTTDLSGLYVDNALQYLKNHEAEIYFHTPIDRIERTAGGYTLASRDHRLDSRYVIVTVPPAAFARLASVSGALRDTAIDTGTFEPSEIASAHVWTHVELSPELMTGLLDSTVQWIFNKGRQSDGSWRYACVISAANEHRNKTVEEMTAIVSDDLRTIFPQLHESDIIRIKLVREAAATFIPRPGMQEKRPSTGHAQESLFIAGDWSATSLPATIEGAVRSGHEAANCVMMLFLD